MIREILGKSISNKLFGLSKQDKEKQEKEKNTLLGVAALKIIAKNMLLLPRMGRDFKIIAKGFGKFLTNETGEKPAKESLFSKLAPIKDRFVLKTKESKEKREEKAKKSTLLDIVIETLFGAALSLVAIVIFNKDLLLRVLEMYGGIEGIIGSALDSMYSTITDYFSNFDFGQTIVDEMSSFIEFISFGLITKKDATKVLESIGTFIKPLTDRIGYFLSGVGEWMREKLMNFGRSLDKGIGIETEGVKEERRKELEADPYANAVETIKALDEDISLLKTRIITLKEYIEKRKVYEQEKSQGQVQREAPKLPPIISPSKRVSDKSIFAPSKEFAPTGPLQNPVRGMPSGTTEKVPAREGDVNATPKVDQPMPSPSAYKATKEITLSKVVSKSGKAAYVNSQVAPRFQALIDWFESINYNIRSLGGYNQRKIAGTDHWSTHSYGAAIDINPDKNPMVSSNAPNWTDMPVEQTSAVAKKLGLGWGGDWRNKKDAMHFSIAKNEGGDTPLSVIESAGLPMVTQNGGQLAKNSSDVELEQRRQSKPQNATVINAGITNNTTVISERKMVAS